MESGRDRKRKTVLLPWETKQSVNERAKRKGGSNLGFCAQGGRLGERGKMGRAMKHKECWGVFSGRSLSR
jgi:hypothetical protein